MPIIYTDDDIPGRVFLTAYKNTSVVADPLFSFGQPIVNHLVRG
jgi:hypothetical protein